MQNNKRYILAGAGFVLIIGNLLLLLELLYGCEGKCFNPGIIDFINAVPSIVVYWISSITGLKERYFSYIFIELLYFAFGLLCGWIYGKIKNRNRV